MVGQTLTLALHSTLTNRCCRSGILLMTVGGVIAASESGYLERVGYALVLLNNIFTAAFLLRVKTVSRKHVCFPLLGALHTAAHSHA